MLGGLIDVWMEEELKVGKLSNSTVENYLQAINRIKQHPVSGRKLKTVTSEQLQQSFRFAVFPKQLITFNLMQYMVLKKKTDSADLFAEENAEDGEVKTLTYELYHRNYYKEVREKNRVFYEYYHLDRTQELLGHSDVSTTMNVYVHATREAKKKSAKLLDMVVGQ